MRRKGVYKPRPPLCCFHISRAVFIVFIVPFIVTTLFFCLGPIKAVAGTRRENIAKNDLKAIWALSIAPLRDYFPINRTGWFKTMEWLPAFAGMTPLS